jgi:uncharacterized protein DUF6441
MAQIVVETNAPAWEKALRKKQRNVANAAVAALREVAAAAVQEGRRDIAGAGRFGANWQRDLQYVTKGATENGEPSLQATAIIFHKSALAGVFEHGATIHGKPLLWIPTTRGAPSPKRLRRKLVSVNVAGKAPMLFAATDKDRDRKPLYIGVPTVRIAKKWHITEIAERQVKRIALFFIKHFKDN